MKLAVILFYFTIIGSLSFLNAKRKGVGLGRIKHRFKIGVCKVVDSSGAVIKSRECDGNDACGENPLTFTGRRHQAKKLYYCGDKIPEDIPCSKMVNGALMMNYTCPDNVVCGPEVHLMEGVSKTVAKMYCGNSVPEHSKGAHHVHQKKRRFRQHDKQKNTSSIAIDEPKIGEIPKNKRGRGGKFSQNRRQNRKTNRMELRQERREKKRARKLEKKAAKRQQKTNTQ